jgi:FkbM family methyltransferase
MQSKIEKIKEIKKNITLIDFLLLPFNVFRQNLNGLFVVRKVVKNWPEVILFRLGLKKRFIIKFRNGKKIKIESINDYFDSLSTFWKSEDSLTFLPKGMIKFKKRKNKIITIKYKNYLVQLYFSNAIRYYQNIEEQFVKEVYKWLNVKEKNIVDVGAYTGESAIYFALNGAKHVYAFEPYPFSYKIALKNVKLNKLEKKITMLNEAVGKSKKTIYIDENYKSDIGEDLKEFKRGKKIKITTLEEIVEKFKLKDAVLKMNCEGCEYCSILNTPNEILRNFEQIMLQYHYGYLNLKKKLEEAGFKVKVSIPQYFINEKTQNPHLVSGHLYAQRLS